MLAIVKTGGKQYKVKPGDVLEIEKIESEDAEKVIFSEILFLDNEKELKIGNPFVEGAKVEAKILGQVAADKVVTIKHKSKKRYLKKQGHKQLLTKVEIVKIS